jgi:hypothetical protein
MQMVQLLSSCKSQKEGFGVRKTETSHFWVGHFSKALAETYTAEVYDPDDEDREHTPLSAFARDQGEKWYDHDRLEYGFSPRPKRVEKLVEGYSYSDQWGAELAKRATEAGLTEINWFAFISKGEISKPCSIQGDGYWLHYLGTIRYCI